MIPITTDEIIKVIRDEICNPELNLNFICYRLNCSDKTIYKRVKEDFDTTPSQLIECVRLFKIFKYTYDHKCSVFESARIYGLVKRDSLHKITKRRFNKTPCEIEYELAIEENRKVNFQAYHKQFLINNLLL